MILVTLILFGTGYLVDLGNIVSAATLAEQPLANVEPILIDASDEIVKYNNKRFNLNPYLIFFGMVSVF